MQKAYLYLDSGEVFSGCSFGARADGTGELVFTTAMTGYLETLTDPSYHGQLVVQTFPLIGNYGVIRPDFESEDISAAGYIVREWCAQPSNFRSEGDIDALLRERGVLGLYGVDTRALTRLIRERGSMNARISAQPELSPAEWDALRAYRVKNSVEAVTCKEMRIDTPNNEVTQRVVLWDFGAKLNIRRELLRRGCEVITMPSASTAREILAQRPDGIMLSNGPGDPADNPGIIAELAKLCETNVPIFGICLGHQLLALARGARTEKLKYGHRGANQPARDTKTGRVYITSQNHGYAVVSDSLPKTAVERYINANDHTCEGVDYVDRPAFSVQFHPEACAGPLDTSFLFDRMMAMMQEVHANA